MIRYTTLEYGPGGGYCGRKPCQQICTAVDRKNREDKAAAKKDKLDAKVAKPKPTPKRQAQGSAQNAVKPMVNLGRASKKLPRRAARRPPELLD